MNSHACIPYSSEWSHTGGTGEWSETAIHDDHTRNRPLLTPIPPGPAGTIFRSVSTWLPILSSRRNAHSLSSSLAGAAVCCTGTMFSRSAREVIPTVESFRFALDITRCWSLWLGAFCGRLAAVVTIIPRPKVVSYASADSTALQFNNLSSSLIVG